MFLVFINPLSTNYTKASMLIMKGEKCIFPAELVRYRYIKLFISRHYIFAGKIMKMLPGSFSLNQCTDLCLVQMRDSWSKAFYESIGTAVQTRGPDSGSVRGTFQMCSLQDICRMFSHTLLCSAIRSISPALSCHRRQGISSMPAFQIILCPVTFIDGGVQHKMKMLALSFYLLL